MSVVLPAPLGPMTACTSPMASSSETSLTAASPPKCLDKPSTRSIGSGTARLEMTAELHEGKRKTPQAARQEQDRGDDEKPHGQEPVLGLAGEKILQQHEDEGAEHRPVQCAHAAQDHHHEHAARLAPA